MPWSYLFYSAFQHLTVNQKLERIHYYFWWIDLYEKHHFLLFYRIWEINCSNKICHNIFYIHQIFSILENSFRIFCKSFYVIFCRGSLDVFYSSQDLTMEHSAQLVDKAVSTEDLSFETRDVNLDVARLEAVLHTLVENKVEAMKNEKTKSSSSHSTPMTWDKRLHRITSSSTASSSHNHGRDHRHYHKKRNKAYHDEYEKGRKSGRTRSNG